MHFMFAGVGLACFFLVSSSFLDVHSFFLSLNLSLFHISLASFAPQILSFPSVENMPLRTFFSQLASFPPQFLVLLIFSGLMRNNLNLLLPQGTPLVCLRPRLAPSLIPGSFVLLVTWWFFQEWMPWLPVSESCATPRLHDLSQSPQPLVPQFFSFGKCRQ